LPNTTGVFVCFCVFLSGSLADGLAIAQATSASGALQCLYGVTHAGGILTEGLGKEKPTVGKKSDFSWNFNSRAGEEDG
jgi:hypothetical protein